MFIVLPEKRRWLEESRTNITRHPEAARPRIIGRLGDVYFSRSEINTGRKLLRNADESEDVQAEAKAKPRNSGAAAAAAPAAGSGAVGNRRAALEEKGAH